MNSNYAIETAESGVWQTRMRDVSFEDSQEYINQLVTEKKSEGYVVLDSRATVRSGVIIMQSPEYKPFAIRRVQNVVVTL